MRTTASARGWSFTRRMFAAFLTRSTARVTLNPLAVEPAQPPMKRRSSSTHFESGGHVSKSADTKPVVESDVTWNTAKRSAPPAVSPRASMRLTVTKSVATTMMPRYARNSVLRTSACGPFFQTL